MSSEFQWIEINFAPLLPTGFHRQSSQGGACIPGTYSNLIFLSASFDFQMYSEGWRALEFERATAFGLCPGILQCEWAAMHIYAYEIYAYMRAYQYFVSVIMLPGR